MKIAKYVISIYFIISIGVFGISRWVIYADRDEQPPVLSCEEEEFSINCAYEEEQLLEGVTAWDKEEGDITDSIIVEPFSRFISKGVSKLTYIVFDSENQFSKITRRVTFADYSSPKLGLKHPLSFSVGDGSNSAALSHVTATDMLDGDISGLVSVKSNADFESSGIYEVTFSVHNSFGDEIIETLPLHVEKKMDEGIAVELSSYLVYLGQGEWFDPGAYLQSITLSNGNPAADYAVDIEGGVDSNVPGVYEITYRVHDVNGNIGGNRLIVIVKGVDER